MTERERDREWSTSTAPAPLETPAAAASEGESAPLAVEPSRFAEVFERTLELTAVEPISRDIAHTLVGSIPIDRHPPSPQGKALQEVRCQLGLTLGDAAAAFGLSVVEVSALEHGGYTCDWAQARALLLGYAALRHARHPSAGIVDTTALDQRRDARWMRLALEHVLSCRACQSNIETRVVGNRIELVVKVELGDGP